MNKYDDLRKDIDLLCEEGEKLTQAIKAGNNGQPIDFPYFSNHYDDWYSKAIIIVKTFIPERKEDFVRLYQNEKRKDLNYSTYTISDALRHVVAQARNCTPSSAFLCMRQQKTILHSVLGCLESRIANIQTLLQADLFDSEIESAKHLLKNGFIRAAGAICGVVIEKHLSAVCQKYGVEVRKKRPAINDYNELLKDIAYDNVQWRKIQYCADIRNLCDHDGDREPTKTELEELISGTEQIIKNVA